MPARNKISESKFVEMLAHELGTETYIFGFPLVLMDITRQVFETKSPINQFVHIRAFPDETFTDVVSPNADTLYSSGFLDLSKEPLVLTLPDVGDRYYLMQLLDAWTNVFATLGTRTTGNRKQNFVITGPGWKGKLPDETPVIQSPTNLVWIIGRTQTNGTADYSAVHAIQDQYRLFPLHAFGYPYPFEKSVLVDPKIDTKTPPLEQVAAMDPVTFLNRMCVLMGKNPPSDADAQIMRGLISAGIVPGKSIKFANLNRFVARGIESGCRSGFRRIAKESKTEYGRVVNGWEFSENLGRYGTRYLWRASVAMFGLGANLPVDAVYGRATIDGNGRRLSGANRYVVHFAKGQLPPVNAFWSLTMYNDRQFFVANPIHRFAIGDRDHLKFDSDGSLTLYVQHDSPGPEAESNWLPAPAENFNIILRLYWPKEEIVEERWAPPGIEPASAGAKKAA